MATATPALVLAHLVHVKPKLDEYPSPHTRCNLHRCTETADSKRGKQQPSRLTTEDQRRSAIVLYLKEGGWPKVVLTDSWRKRHPKNNGGRMIRRGGFIGRTMRCGYGMARDRRHLVIIGVVPPHSAFKWTRLCPTERRVEWRERRCYWTLLQNRLFSTTMSTFTQKHLNIVTLGKMLCHEQARPSFERCVATNMHDPSSLPGRGRNKLYFQRNKAPTWPCIALRAVSTCTRHTPVARVYVVVTGEHVPTRRGALQYPWLMCNSSTVTLPPALVGMLDR